MARHYGLKKLAVPSAGNAAERCGLCGRCRDRSKYFMPKDVPFATMWKPFCTAQTSRSWMADSDCGRIVVSARKRRLVRHFYFEGTVSHRRKKTMGYELSKQLGWEYPLRFFIRREAALGLLECGRPFIELENSAGCDPAGGRE